MGQAIQEERSVLLSLSLSKSGVVREAKVLAGPTELRSAAIEAAKRRKYKSGGVNGPDATRQMMVAVIFPPGKDGPTEIREAMAAGVSSCIPTPMAVRISAEVMQSFLLNRVDPVFPVEAQHVEGTLVLQLHIDKDGNVYKAEKVSGPDELFPAASEAVKQWKYRPYILNGYPIGVETKVDFKSPG